MALNPGKTQVLWIDSGLNSPTVSIGSSLATPVNTIEFLGLKFDRKLKSDPHIRSITSAVATLVGLTRRLKVHLPPRVWGRISCMTSWCFIIGGRQENFCSVLGVINKENHLHCNNVAPFFPINISMG